MKLADVLLDESKRPQVIDDCCRFLDEEVGRKKGLSGLAIKAGYKVVKAIKPGLIREAFGDLLGPFTDKLEPFFADWKAQGNDSFEAFVGGRTDSVAEALLGITDDRARRAKQGAIKKTYDKLRPTGKKNVVEAIPGIGRLIDRHV